jgi:hypothetical protein
LGSASKSQNSIRVLESALLFELAVPGKLKFFIGIKAVKL